MSDDDRATRMYGSTTGDSSSNAPSDTPNEAAPDSPTAGVTTSQPHEADRAERMYGPAGTHVDPYQHCGLVELIDELDGIQPEEHRQARVQEVSQEMIKLDLSGDEASQLMRLLHMQVAEPADEETVDEWQAESEAALRATYGSQASAVLDRAQRWLAQRPKAREQLDWSGLGSHPTVVKMLVEKSEAASLRKRNTAPKNRWKR